MSPKMDEHLVIFDCDGVLVDSEPVGNRLLVEHISAVGVSMTVDEVRDAFWGMRWTEIVSLVERRSGQALGEAWWNRYERDREEAFRRELRPIAGAEAALEALTVAGVPFCVATQARLAKMLVTLDVTGLAGYLPEAARFSADQVARGKPHPDLFEFAAASMGFAASACTVVEDSEVGVVAAIQAGMDVLGYATGDRADRLAAAGAQIIDDMAAVPRLVGARGA